MIGTEARAPEEERIPADRTKRAGAFFIDWVLAMLLSLVPILGWYLGAGYMLFRDGFSTGILDRRSFGKKIFRIRPISLSGVPVTFSVSARRNALFAAPLVLLLLPLIGVFLASISSLVIVVAEAGLALTRSDGRRTGDRLAGTLVVEAGD